MPLTKNRFSIVFSAIIAITAWVALALQFYITINDAITTGKALLSTLIFYFSFFTILTNLLVALSATASIAGNNFKAGRFLSQANTQSAITVYIIVVGLVYNLVLRQLWRPQGLQLPVDELLHVVVPLLFLVYWVVFVPKTAMRWVHAFTWLLYPAVYLVYILLRGALVGEYPYPFVDVSTLGYSNVLLNSSVLLLIFLGLGFVLIAVGRLFKPKQ